MLLFVDLYLLILLVEKGVFLVWCKRARYPILCGICVQNNVVTLILIIACVIDADAGFPSYYICMSKLHRIFFNIDNIRQRQKYLLHGNTVRTVPFESIQSILYLPIPFVW